MRDKSQSGSTFLEISICLCILAIIIQSTLPIMVTPHNKQNTKKKYLNIYYKLSPIIKTGKCYHYNNETFTIHCSDQTHHVTTQSSPNKQTISLHLPTNHNVRWQYWSQKQMQWLPCESHPRPTRAIKLQIIDRSQFVIEEFIFATTHDKLSKTASF